MTAILSWICSVLGSALVYVVLLGNAMCTVPRRLRLFVAMLLGVLPVIGLGIGVSAVGNDFALGIP